MLPLPADLPPAAVLWIWNQPPAALSAHGTVAIVDRHIWLTGDKVLLRPGARPRNLPPNVRVTPVVHVELDPLHPPASLDKARPGILAAMNAAASANTSGWVQLDLEARPSQRADYLALVREIRTALPQRVKLSVTALAWWCGSRAWLDNLAADEVVPMFFRMGRDNLPLRAIVERHPERLHPRCRGDSAGFSLQEPFPAPVTARYRQTYWFDEQGWKAYR
jgi:hypothetical protein